MNVSLTPELERLVSRKVQSGLYNSASEVVREALRLLQEQEDLKALRREELRKDIMKGIEDVRAGRYIALETPEDFDNLAETVKREGRQSLPAKQNGK